MPKHVGTWVLASVNGDIIKWGKNGNTKFPYSPNDPEALEQAKYVDETCDGAVYLLQVFDNGQIKQDEIVD